MDIILDIAKKAKDSTRFISNANTNIKNKILYDISKYIVDGAGEIIEENKKDL